MKQKRKKLLSIMLTLCMLIALMPQQTLVARADTGTATNTMTSLYTSVVANGGIAPKSGTYSISSSAELRLLAEYVNAGNTAVGITFQLTGDLDMNPGFTFDSSGYYTGDGTPDMWTPIGKDTAVFSGTFDGGSNTISSLFIYYSGVANYQGLFGYIGEKGTVKNLKIGNGKIRADDGNYMGGIAGNNDGTITNCSNGTVFYGDKYVGGIAGYNVGTITNCSNSAFVRGYTTNIGGIVGNCNHGGTISNSYNTGNVTGGRTTGGIVGYNNSSTICNNYNTGSVNGTYYIGGISGYSKLSTINNNYNTGDIFASSYTSYGSAGGIVGYCYSGTLNNNYNAGDVSGYSTHIGGIVGHRYAGYVRYCYWLKTSDICSDLDATGYGTSTGCGYIATSDGNITWVDNSDNTVVTGDNVTLQNALNAWVKEYKNESSYDTWTVTSENNGFPVLGTPWVSTLKTVAIKYFSSDGSDLLKSQTVTIGRSCLSSYEPAADGEDFLGWATTSNSDTAKYLPLDIYTAGDYENDARPSELNLYTVWGTAAGTETHRTVNIFDSGLGSAGADEEKDVYITSTGSPSGKKDVGASFVFGEAQGEITSLPGASAQLIIYAYDVDAPDEVDTAYLVDETNSSTWVIGKLSGMNDDWNTTVLQFPQSLFQSGHTYQLQITASDGFAVYIRSAYLILDGGEDVDNIIDKSVSVKLDADGHPSATTSLTTENASSYDLEYKFSSVENDSTVQIGGGTGTISTGAGETGTDTSTWNDVTVEKGTTYQVDVTIKKGGSPISTITKTFEVYDYSYDLNGHGNSISGGTVLSGEKLNRPEPDPKAEGYTFGGWYKEISCTNPWDFSVYTVNADTTLYALWAKNFGVTYDNGGADAGSVPEDSTVYNSGNTVTVLGNTGSLAKSGYQFAGWSDGKKTYTAGDTFTITRDTVLTAIWNKKAYTVYCYRSDTEVYDMQIVNEGEKAVEPEEPERSGFVFGGWYQEKNCINQWDFSIYTVNADTNLYAQWVDNEDTYPVIGTQPVSQAVAEGHSANFTVIASTEIGTLSYQWQKKDSGGTWSNISGATGATYAIDSVTADDAGEYRCIVTNSSGTKTKSDAAVLNVTYDVTVTINKDGYASPDTVTGNVELKQDGDIKATLSENGGVYTANVANGTYDVYVNGEDTGVDLTINDAANSVTVNYYTVSFSTTITGMASGGSVTAMVDGINIDSGATVLAGKKIVLSASGMGADYYSYFWEGTGINRQDVDKLIISDLSGKVDVKCTVTGRETAPTYSVSLNTNGGSISSGSLVSYTYGAGAMLPINVTRENSVFIGWYADSDFSGSPVTVIGTDESGNKTYYAKWNYDISGTITDGNEPIAGVTVTIRGNNITKQTTYTDQNGNYSFSDIPPGEYNIIAVSPENVIRTIIISVTNANTTDANIQMPEEGKKDSVVTVADNTPDVVVGYLDQQFSSSDDTYVGKDSGNTVKIELTVEKQDEDVADGAENIQELAGNRKVDMYLDMALIKTVTGEESSSGTLTETSSLLKIVIPYDVSGKTNITVYRVHNGLSEALTEKAYSADAQPSECFMVDYSHDLVIVWANKFSTYAIAYSNISSDNGSSGRRSHTIDTSAGDGGTIRSDKDSSVANGGSITYTITPDKGYYISDVLVDGKSVGAVTSYTFKDVTQKHTIKAVFAEITGLPFYLDGSDKKVFIGFAADASGKMEYIAPKGEEVLFIPNPKGFTDISNHWAKPYIDFVTEREIFVGTGNDTFSPDTGMTRAMFAAVIGRMYERSYGTISVAGETFTDVTSGAYYSKYVRWAEKNGIILGIGENRFAPDREINREEMAAILYRFAEFLKVSGESSGVKLSYPDTNEIDPWATEAVKYCNENEIVLGRTNGNFAPLDTATRAEVAAILKRFTEVVVKSSLR